MQNTSYENRWIKDHDFYNVEKWDNKKLSCDKVYQFYHKYSDQNKGRIENIRKQ